MHGGHSWVGRVCNIFSDVHMFSHVNVQPINDSINAFASQSESCILYFQIQIAFRIWRLFSQRLLQNFLRRPRKAIDLFQLVAAQTCLYSIKKTRTHRANRRVMSHCSKKERDWKYWCKRRQRVNRHFAAPSAWVFLICVKKTISMKILLLRVINSSRHRNCFVRGYIHLLFVSKALTRSYHSFGFSHKQLVNTTPFAALSMTWTIFTSGPTSLSLKARTYELLKIGSFKLPAPQAKMVFKCPNPIDGFVCKLLPSFAVRGEDGKLF